MKTIIIYNDIETVLKFAIVDGDYSKFHGVVFNSMKPHEYEVECGKFLFNDESGAFKLNFTEDISLLENKGWDKIAVIIFIP